MMTILLTGFGPFPGAQDNPTARIVESLAEAPPPGVRLVTHILPVIWREADTRIAQLIAQSQPQAILHLGLARTRSIIGVETRARNEATRLMPDAENICRTTGTILPQGPGLRHARLDCAAVVARLQAQGLLAETSDDAGDYICNETLYLSLGSDVRHVGFIHVPMPKDEAELSQMSAGVADVVQMLAHKA